jgi:hypothetical protein
MKLFVTYLVIYVAAFQVGCKSTRNNGFIKSTSKRDITLKSISEPYVVFVLQNADTIRFSKLDVSDAIDDQLNNEIKKWGYITSKHLTDLAEILKPLRSDTMIYQNLAAVDSKSLSGNLDLWIAKELLFNGKAEISLQDQAIKVTKLKYVYTKNILGGEQGSFYTVDNKKVYTVIISLGE